MKGKIHLEDHYDKNQQILIRVNEGATRNNAVLLPAEQLLVLSLGIYDEVPGKFGEWNNAVIGG